MAPPRPDDAPDDSPFSPPCHPQPRTVFGSGGDIKPLSLTVVRDHCVVFRDEAELGEGGEEGGEEGGGEGEGEGDALAPAPATFTLECGQGDTYLNGR